jgi:hypothetical protein
LVDTKDLKSFDRKIIPVQLWDEAPYTNQSKAGTNTSSFRHFLIITNII